MSDDNNNDLLNELEQISYHLDDIAGAANIMGNIKLADILYNLAFDLENVIYKFHNLEEG